MKRKVYVLIAVVLLLGAGTVFVLLNNNDSLKESSNETCPVKEATSCSLEKENKGGCNSCSQQCKHDCPYFNKELSKSTTGCNGHCSGHNQ